MINGLGGTPINELYLLYRKAALNCQNRGLAVVRNYVGNYCTSLEMMGASLTLIRLDEELERLLDAPADMAVPADLLMTDLLNRPITRENRKHAG